jgi:hypothetical protein
VNPAILSQRRNDFYESDQFPSRDGSLALAALEKTLASDSQTKLDFDKL